uniref:Ig-like domain-containing protein n=1 Tax=Myripristis murdjan TaxID=586833 RepID=A0A667Z296_9TELE
MASKKLSLFRTLFGFFFFFRQKVSHVLVLSPAFCCVFSCSPEVRAVVGENVTLPCHTKLPKDLQSLTVEWKYNKSFVHYYRNGQDDLYLQHQQYRHRTILSHEDLVKGNLSLKLLHVQLSDQGNYTCSVVKLSNKTKVTSGSGGMGKAFSRAASAFLKT